jgi:ribosomal protein L35
MFGSLLGGVVARLAAPSHGLLRARPFLELARSLANDCKYKIKTNSSAKKRFHLNANGRLMHKKTGKHHKQVRQTSSQSNEGGMVRVMSQKMSTRLRKCYFPGW